MTKRHTGFDGHAPAAARWVFGVFGLAFLGIGVSVILFLWTSPFGAFHSPPLIFRVVGSFIAVVFVAVGGSIAWAAITGNRPNSRFSGRFDGTGQRASGRSGYSCPQCGAPLGDDADVSPHGDVKCSHCSSWFNIHAH